MTVPTPLDPDERPPEMANDGRVVILAVLGTWLILAGLLWLMLRGEETDGQAAVLASAIIATAAGTAHAVIAVSTLRSLGKARWALMVGVLLVCSWAGHALLAGLGMSQSLGQDLVNLTVISGIALAVREAWSGHRARRSLAAETVRRAKAEDQLSQSRLRPPGLVAVKVGHGERMIDPAAVSRIEAEGNFAVLHDRSGPVFASEPLKALVERLAPHGFVRVHKSHAVNADWVRERRSDAVVMEGGTTVPVGRAYRV